MPSQLKKVSTGIKGLDEVTGGGLPAGRATLICGGPGCGKTLLATSFIVQGARNGEPAVFVTFDQAAADLDVNSRSLGFDLAGLQAKNLLSIDYIHIDRQEIHETGEYSLEGLFIRLGFAIDQIKAKRVVLDGIDTLFAGLPNEALLRSELRRLFGWLKERGLSSIITAERGEKSLTRHGIEEYVSDCVIVLEQRVQEELTTRRLRVVKYRGSVHGTNEYPYLIEEGGIKLLPITSLGLAHAVSSQRISTGIAGLDAMLEGKGFYKGSSILISGGPGTGKTSIGAHFAVAAAERDEHCLYFAFEESQPQLVRNMRSIGIDLQPAIDKGRLSIESVRPPKVFTLKSAAEPYRLLVEQMREGAITLSLEGGVLYCNEAFANIVGKSAPRIIGASMLDYLSERDFKHLADHRGCRGCEMSIRKVAGGHAAVTVSSVPLLVDGEPVISAVVTDLSGHQLHLRHEAIVKSVGVPIYSLSPDLIIENWNPGAATLYGYAPHEIVGQPVRILCSSEDECKAFEAFATEVAQRGHALARDARRLRKDGSVVEVILCLAPLHNRDGGIMGYAAITHDITERKAQEKTRQLLVDELNHRVKNTLAMVQSIARLTLRQTKSPEDFAQSFTGRIQALAGAHDVLTASSWHGADIASLVRDQLILGDTNECRFSSIGPRVKLDPQTAVSLSLVLHELGTNASKYGALSTGGNVDLRWEIAENGTVVKLRWQERGGPKVTEPARRGFGTFIIEQSLNSLDGEANIQFEPAGLVCDMWLPIRKMKHPADLNT